MTTITAPTLTKSGFLQWGKDDLDDLERRATEGCPHHLIPDTNMETVCSCFEESAHVILALIGEVRTLQTRLAGRIAYEAEAKHGG